MIIGLNGYGLSGNWVWGFEVPTAVLLRIQLLFVVVVVVVIIIIIIIIIIYYN